MRALQVISHLVLKPSTASGHQPALTAVPGDLTLWSGVPLVGPGRCVQFTPTQYLCMFEVSMGWALSACPDVETAF